MERRPAVLGALRKDIDVKLSAARMFESVKPWITAEERADAEKKVGAQRRALACFVRDIWSC